MQLVLASTNRGKVREFNRLCDEKVVLFSDLMESFEIVEDGDTFAQNALIKARTIYERLGDGYIVISDDSGISLPILDNAPGIYSARYAGEGASDRDNLNRLIDELKSRGIKRTDAYYTASIAVVSSLGEFVVHGWMHGDVVVEMRGDGGFGYDPIFIPTGYSETLGELDESIKAGISHRAKALKLAKPIIEMLQKRRG